MQSSENILSNVNCLVFKKYTVHELATHSPVQGVLLHEYKFHSIFCGCIQWWFVDKSHQVVNLQAF